VQKHRKEKEINHLQKNKQKKKQEQQQKEKD
jgi:hypothetical protein